MNEKNMQNTCLLICHFKTVDSMTLAGSNMRFWDTGVLLHCRRLSRAGTGRRTVHSGGPRDPWSCTDTLQLQFPVGKSNTRSSLSVQGAISVTHPQSPLSPCLYNFVVLRHVIQWLIDWCLHSQCKSSEKSISFRFFIFYFFCFSQCNTRLPCANTHKNISSEKRTLSCKRLAWNV